MLQIKKANAEGEDAWKGAGKEEGLQIWRIVQFKVTHWPKKDYSKFYTGDSYIILNTYKKDPSSRVSDVGIVHHRDPALDVIPSYRMAPCRTTACGPRLSQSRKSD